MNDNDNNGKLDWMYKGANSLVNREEYLLGKSVDKSLEQLNAEEKEKKLGLVPPKNHVEHECIPPSIRDFNKIVQAEQVDISAKLQEDPLVAIKKREEEARRQFLQNPVQLKKLQEALKAQELKKKKVKRKKSKDDSESDLDSKIAKKLKYLKGYPSSASVLKKKKKKSKDDTLDTILMHKFNELKDQLSQDDLNDILAGKISDSDEETEKKEKKSKRRSSSSEEVERKEKKSEKVRRKRRSSSTEKFVKKSSKKRRDSSSSSDTSSEDERSKKTIRKKRDEGFSRDKNDNTKKTTSEAYKSKRRKQASSSSEDSSEDERKERKYKKKMPDKKNKRDRHTKERNFNEKAETDRTQVIPDLDLESKILEKLRILRESIKSKKPQSSSDSDSSDSVSDPRNRQNDSDSDEKAPKPMAFGLVKADGTKIALNKNAQEIKKSDRLSKVETSVKPEKKNVKRLSEEEKDRMRREMMKNAEKRDKERSENLRKYREEDKREEKSAGEFDKEFMHKQLVRSTKEATVESRIKSNLNNIQRSSRHMDTHFSRR